MLSKIKFVPIALAVCSLFVFTALQATAVPPDAPPAADGAIVDDADDTIDNNTIKDADGDTKRGTAYRASDIPGMKVVNEKGTELGTINDTVIDVGAGEVRYAALSHGGTLGVGDKLFAVPWKAFTHRHNTETNEHTFVLTVDEETFKSAPGFDQDNWPNFGDPKFNDSIEKHYGAHTLRDRIRGADVDVRVGEGVSVRVGQGVDVRVGQKRAPDVEDNAAPSTTRNMVHRTSEINGMMVKNQADKDLGSISDLVVDMDTGKVRYAALSHGGVLGVGDKLFAIPWRSFNMRYDAEDEEHYFVLAVDESLMEKAPGFDQDNWPDLADPSFGDEIDKYYKDVDEIIEDRPADIPNQNVPRERNQ